MDAPTMIMATLIAASSPHIETSPVPAGVGDGEIVGCNYRIDGSKANQYVPVEQRDDGVVCVFPISPSLADGAHMIDARYVYMQGVTKYSERRGFEKRTVNGGTVWTITGEVVCNPDCVRK